MNKKRVLAREFLNLVYVTATLFLFIGASTLFSNFILLPKHDRLISEIDKTMKFIASSEQLSKCECLDIIHEKFIENKHLEVDSKPSEFWNMAESKIRNRDSDFIRKLRYDLNEINSTMRLFSSSKCFTDPNKVEGMLLNLSSFNWEDYNKKNEQRAELIAEMKANQKLQDYFGGDEDLWHLGIACIYAIVFPLRYLILTVIWAHKIVANSENSIH